MQILHVITPMDAEEVDTQVETDLKKTGFEFDGAPSPKVERHMSGWLWLCNRNAPRCSA